MTFDHYQTQALTTYSNRSFPIHYPAEGLASEVGEVLGHVKKMWRDDQNILTPERGQKLYDELGDCLWYLAMLAEDCGWDLGAIAQDNLAKLQDRKARGVIQGSGDKR